MAIVSGHSLLGQVGWPLSVGTPHGAGFKPQLLVGVASQHSLWGGCRHRALPWWLGQTVCLFSNIPAPGDGGGQPALPVMTGN